MLAEGCLRPRDDRDDDYDDDDDNDDYENGVNDCSLIYGIIIS